jgi:drug/metabolite transporter (DMT)-like permease
MVAFASNSLLCRLALRDTRIDAASFTTLRIVSGACVLWVLSRWSRRGSRSTPNWPSALALFAYAAGFSFAYRSLSAATGSLLLFGAVQATMMGAAVWAGERISAIQKAGILLALGGLVFLVMPGLSAPPLVDSLLMAGAGVAWGIYSLRGKGAEAPILATGGNFLRAVPLVAGLSLVTASHLSLDGAGIGYAVASGALASGVGYAIWYKVLPVLKSTQAAIVQLSVPVLAACGAVVFLGESVTPRLACAALAILAGIAIAVFERPSVRSSR